MKTILATVLLVALGTIAVGTAAQAGAPQAPAHRVVSPPARYWLSDDLNRLVFWKVRAPAQTSAGPIASR